MSGGWSCVPCHLWLRVADHTTLQVCCDVVHCRPDLYWVLLPKMTQMSVGVTLHGAAKSGHLAVCQWLTERFGLTRRTRVQTTTPLYVWLP
jgi:hypothetical protein